MGYTLLEGQQFTLPTGPPLRQPPLSLVDLAPTLVDVAQGIADEGAAAEALLSAQTAEVEAVQNDDAGEDAAEVIAGLRARILDASEWVNAAKKARADLERWEEGFTYLPELALGSTETWFAGTAGANLKGQGDNLPDTYWYDPFEAVSRDERRLLGWLDFDQRKQRARRSLIAHEPWQVEHEFWTGALVPTNYHLAASPSTPTSTAKRSIDAWPLPTAPPGTSLGTVVGLRKSLAARDQSIADSDAGVGMIHATPYLVQLWSSVYSFLRDAAGNLLTVNKNLIVPGYGYPGTGPDAPDRTVTAATHTTTAVDGAPAASFSVLDVGAAITGAGIPAGTTVVAVTGGGAGVTLSQAATATAAGVVLTVHAHTANTGADQQWAYATDTVFKFKGPIHDYPSGYGQQGALLQGNDAAVRSERPWALITNRLLRAAVLVDTTV